MSFSMMFLLPLIGIVLCLIFIRVEVVKKFLSLVLFGILIYFNVVLFGYVGKTFKFPFSIVGQSLTFRVTYLNLYFSLMISGISFLTVLFSLRFMEGKENASLYYLWLLVKTFGMFGVIFSNDFLTFFIAWEIMSWSTYLLMIQSGGDAVRASYKYLVYAISSAMILLAGIAILYVHFGSFDFAKISAGYGDLSTGVLLLTAILFVVSFSVEAAVFPLHSWLPDAYSKSFSPITSYLAGISTRMGIYAIILFLFGIVGARVIDKLQIIGVINFRYILGLFAVLTMVIPTYTALFQNDAKKLVTWHGIGQGGYMLVGIVSGSALGIAGGIFHVLNHLTYVTVILFSIAAVEYRTGTTNLNKLGGLIKKMPVSFVGLLFGIIGLAGIPPMNGFVSKWFIYRALILNGYPLLAIGAVIGTLGTILSVYKLIHNIFLGQLPEEYNNVKEVPIDMQIPIWILGLATMVFGVYPGLAVSLIAKIQTSLGLEAVKYSMNGVVSSAGQLNMLVISIVFMGGLAVAYIVYLLGHRRKHVVQYDNYAAGNFLSKDIPYNYNYHFYAGIEHIFEPYRKKIVERSENSIAALAEAVGEYLRRIYTGNVTTYAIYIVASFLIVAIIAGKLF